MILTWILTLAIIAGQMIKIPVGTQGGMTLLDLCVTALTTYGIIKVKFQFKTPPLFLKIFLLFLITGIVSLFLTPLNLTTLEYVTSFFYSFRLLSYVVIYWLIYSGFFNNLKGQIKNILLYSGLGLSLLGLLQFLVLPDLKFLTANGWDPHYFRTVSTFLDPNFAGAYFVLTLTLLIQKKWNIFIFAIIYLALLTTFSRSSYLMFLISSLSISFFQKSKKMALVTVLLFVVLMLGFQIYTQLVARPRGIDREQSAQFRLSTWQQGLAIFQKSPLIGVGYNNYRYAIREYKLADEQFYKSHGASGNDSSLLFVLATTGILGFTIYILFLLSLLKYAVKNNSVLIAAILGLLVHSVFANSLFYPFILIWLLLKAADTKN